MGGRCGSSLHRTNDGQAASEGRHIPFLRSAIVEASSHAVLHLAHGDHPGMAGFRILLSPPTNQETVDAAPTFPEVLVEFEKWLLAWDLLDGKHLKSALWVTDGVRQLSSSHWSSS